MDEHNLGITTCEDDTDDPFRRARSLRLGRRANLAVDLATVQVLVHEMPHNFRKCSCRASYKSGVTWEPATAPALADNFDENLR